MQPPDDDSELMNQIHDIWNSTPFFGYRKIWSILRHLGYLVNRKRIQRLMRIMKLQAIYPKKKLSKGNPAHAKYPYLLKNLIINKPNMALCTDITYIKMTIGFVYLVAIIDVYSRYVLGWRLSTTMEMEFCLEMLEEILQRVTPEFLNTDQGSQFTSPEWIARVESSGAKVSMDGKGRWADNIPIERFWRSLKYEGILLHSYKSVAEAREAIGTYLQFYNEQRPHQSLDYETPGRVYRHEVTVMPYVFKKQIAPVVRPSFSLEKSSQDLQGGNI
jgi:putative transposase